MKIGFFGGSFNPPTIAHLELAKKAIKDLNLDKVIFVPISDFYEKKELANLDSRIEMLEILCDGEKNLEVSSLEKNFKERKYAIDVFKIIEQENKANDFYFLMGEDNFVNMPKWKEYESLKKYKYIVFGRNESFKDSNNIVEKDKLFYIKNFEYKDMSSTTARCKIKNNLELDNIIDKDVEGYIYKNKLYL